MNSMTISAPEYVFDSTNNPYFFDEPEPKSLKPIAEIIESCISSNFAVDNILLRGIQSAYHTSMSKEKLIDTIKANGHDICDTDSLGKTILHAAPFEEGIINKILEGFHMYKPKAEYRPQYPVDIWMIFDRDCFDNIEYRHPRHDVMVRDKWELHKGDNGLLGLIIVN